MNDAATFALLRWIPLLPLLAAVIHGVSLGLLRRPLSRGPVIFVSCGTVLTSFMFSFAALFRLIGRPPESRVLVDELYTWIGSGSFSAEAAFLLDPLSAVMILVVTGVGSLIHVYSIAYMDADDREDKGFQRFFCFLNLFMFSMLVLVLADNLVLMFLGWEGVGLCSYLLIGFWYSDEQYAYSGSKAFIVNRIGDFGFLVGIFLLFWSLADAGVASVSFQEIEAGFGRIADRTFALPVWLAWWPGGAEWRLPTVIGLCFFIGAAGKSAQIPLQVWLPDAMAGPTPVSALIHAATMVTAGVYMVCRLSFLYALAPGASVLIAWIGGLTAFLAATVAFTQTDIKKVLAYSTISQLGYMFLAAGCGAYSAAMFHVVTHAFFKALLFLGAGAVILALHHEQDLRKMGGLALRIPITFVMMAIGVVAISGIPPFAGFWSKDQILLAVHLAEHVPGHDLLWGLGVATAGLTSLYMFRLLFLAFFGEPRGDARVRPHIHEPNNLILVPLYVLAVLSCFGGLLGPSEAFVQIENANSFEHFLRPVFAGAAMAAQPAAHEVSLVTEYRLAGTSVALALGGFVLAWLLYVRFPRLPDRLKGHVPSLHAALQNQYGVDALYDRMITRPLVAFSDAWLHRGVDAGGIDGAAVNGLARSVRGLAEHVLKHAQSGLAQSYLVLMVLGSALVLGMLLR